MQKFKSDFFGGNMKKYSKTIPDGMRDIIFDETIVIKDVEKRVNALFEKQGFRRIITPTLEYYDAFEVDGSLLAQEDMYKLSDNTGKLVVLRPDNTTPIARIAGMSLKNQQLPLLIYYSQNIFRINSDYSGKRNEIFQGGVEIIGADGAVADMICLETAFSVFSELFGEDEDYCIEISHTGFFKALIDELELSEDEKKKIISATARRDFTNIFFTDNPAYAEAEKIISALPSLFGGFEVIEKGKELAKNNKIALESLDYVYKIYKMFIDAGYGNKIKLDLEIALKIEYYSGLVFKGYVNDAGEPVISGGRYDNLTKHFGAEYAAVGFAANLNALASVLEHKSKRSCAPPEALIVFDENNFDKAVKIPGKLGLSSFEFSCISDLDKARKYAENRKITKIISVSVSGEEEIKLI